MLKNQNPRLSLIVLVSVLIHAILIAGLYNGKKKPVTAPETPPIIQAELLFVDTANFLPAQASQIQEVELPPAKPEPAAAELEPDQASLEDEPQPDKMIPEFSEILPKPEVDLPQEDVNAKDEAVPEEELKPVAVDALLPEAESSQSAEKSLYQQPLQDVAKSQLSSFQQSQLNSLAAQAASEYRQQRDHPKLGATESDSFLTEAERFEQKVTTSVDCSSTSSQALATVAGFMGGKVKCSEPPPFDAFIQKRLNKTAELPAMQNQDNSNQP